MNKILRVFCALLLLLSWATACRRNEPPTPATTDPQTNLRELWRILDEGYCFFPERFPQEGDWAAVYDRYAAQLTPRMTEDELFDLMASLVNELQDGHVNLYSPFDVSNYWQWSSEEEPTLNTSLRNRYLGSYRRAGGLYYAPIQYNNHAQDSVGLIVCPSFSASITLANWSAVFNRLDSCRALIIDIRDNGGGYVSNASTMASCFLSQTTTVAYLSAKTGPGHHHFGPLDPIVVDPAPAAARWAKPVALLTNRGVYSAANSVAAYLQTAPNVVQIGTTTGGGGGLPSSYELPNGWWLRFSASRTYNAQKELIEWGVEPDIRQTQTPEATQAQEDALIERAIEYLVSQ